MSSVIQHMENLENFDIFTVTSYLQQKANEIRATRINWQSYLQGQMITQEDYDVITRLDSTAEIKTKMMQERPLQCAKTLLTLMDRIAKDQTVQYILTMIDELLQEDKQRVEIFVEYSNKIKRSVWSPFLNMLNRPDGFIINQTSRVIAKMACWGKVKMEGSDLVYYLTWLKDQLKLNQNHYIQTVARCLQMMLRIDVYRHAFYDVDGVGTMISVLAGKHTFQVQYQLLFCLWATMFNADIALKISKSKVIPVLADILSETVKDKVIRMILACFRQLLDKPGDRQVVQANALLMVQCKVLKHLILFATRKTDDNDLKEDNEYLLEKLQLLVQDMSSFDEYCTEVRSGHLEWSPVHKSEKFWRENAGRLNEQNYELLKILIKILEMKDPLSVSVSCHDIGEYVRYYPRGKHVIEQLGGKSLVMQLLLHEDPNVRYEALLAVQKIMVHNWEYLGKQLDAPGDQSVQSKGKTVN